VRQSVNVAPESLTRVVEALWAVVNVSGGTAFEVRDSGLDVAGKTGTAQTGYVAKPEDNPRLAAFLAQHHAWFAAFSPAKAPEVAVVVLVEHGGYGPTVAAPAAFEVLREYHRLAAVRTGGTPPPPKVIPKPKTAQALPPAVPQRSVTP
jgi:penicillin-binding protein 2